MDHLSRVARITTGQIKRLNDAGIATVIQLARAKAAKKLRISRHVTERLIDQAQLQLFTERRRREAGADEHVPPSYRVLPIDPARPRQGLALLPSASPGDVFFDMEGFPLAEGGLEYLYGASYRQGGKLMFCDWWAHDAAEEKRAFEGFVDWVTARWRKNPALHIYHYAPYEVTALRRLMGAHGTREDELDELLRHGVFIDLYKIVQQGLRVGEPSYSIKNVELLYREKRSGDVSDAGESIVFYANWLESGESREWSKSPILAKIRAYNRDDCESTVQLCDWLRHQQGKAGISFLPAETKVPEPEPDSEKEQYAAERTRLAADLGSLVGSEKNRERRKISEMLLHLMEFHRREAKPVWWRMFDRAEQDAETLEDDIGCIGGATLAKAPPIPEKRSLVIGYQFNPDQDTKLAEGSRVYAVPNLRASFEVVALDAETGRIQVKLGEKTLAEKFEGAPPSHTSFIPDEIVPAKVLVDSIHRLATRWVATKTMPEAFRRLLLRMPPRLDTADQTLRRKGERVGDAARRSAASMRGSLLCIQGPPGTGKTYTASFTILSLLKSGKNVGITSNSHKAIQNLLCECRRQSSSELVGLYATNSPPEDWHELCPGVETCGNGEARGKYRGGLVAGTAWVFARQDWTGVLDCLFIDEAGQVSLANVAAMCAATDNLVLLGDQMQLEQPIQGSHPGESGQSALGYYLAGHATVPEELGLFLGETRRLHPEICEFISSLVYDGRLTSVRGNENRRLQPARSAVHVRQSAGILFSPVVHEGNVQSSVEEQARIGEIVGELIGRPRFGRRGERNGSIALEDILFVAPYNMQVRHLKDCLPAGAHVGSVDKFQGQEADIVILSMCSSFGEYGSRGLEFILDRNRMNVALSRARILAIVVGDPRIALAPAPNIDTMRRINLYCRLSAGCYPDKTIQL